MTRKEIINGLKMSMDLTLFDPSTGEVMEPWQLNEVNRTAYEAYKGAIELLEEMPSVQPDTTTHDSIPAETGGNDVDKTSGDCVSRQQAIEPEAISKWKKDFREYVDSLDIARDEWKGIIEYIDDVPTVQPDDDRLERCRFEYINACKIVTYPTPDTTKKDIADAYAVVRALNPIFGEEGF